MAIPGATQRAAASEPWRILRWRSRIWAHQEPLAEGVALTMVRIPAGSFAMGAPETEAGSSDSERPVHRVTLREFLLAQTPITQAQWRAVAEWERPESVEATRWPEALDSDPVAKLEDPERFRGEQRPVVNVSWMEAKAFCERLRLRSGKHYTLPSEAQWEYACRAGTATPFYFGETVSVSLANYDARKVYDDGEKGEHREQTTKAASLPRNP
jgi:formylglycine-generating enzyme required for sulfatase activity